MLMDAAKASLLVVDVQENLTPVVAEPRLVLRHCNLLLRAAERLAVPVTISEQYPKGLGPTMGELLALAPDGVVVEKLHFSCAEEPAILSRLQGFARRQVVVCGAESHVCVLQTCLGLKAQGFDVFVVADACSSRKQSNHDLAMNRLTQAGVSVVSTEMVVFEWLHVAGTPSFKDLIKLVK
ncbi:MAG: hydrolase [Magnetospirillum sp.]